MTEKYNPSTDPSVVMFNGKPHRLDEEENILVPIVNERNEKKKFGRRTSLALKIGAVSLGVLGATSAASHVVGEFAAITFQNSIGPDIETDGIYMHDYLETIKEALGE